MIQPCCGSSLQNGTRIVAIIEIVCAVIYVCINLLFLAQFLPLALDEQNAESENPGSDTKRINSMLTVLLLLNTSFWLGSLLLGIWLHIGAKQRDLRKCRQWFVITCILTVLYTVEILMEAFSMRANASQITSPVIGTLLQVYMLWVVYCFMNEIRLGGSIAIKQDKHAEV